MHVLEIIGTAAAGAVETQVAGMAAKMAARGVRVSALCPFESALTSAMRALGVDVVIVPIADSPSWPAMRTATAYIDGERVDVIRTHWGRRRAGRAGGGADRTSMHRDDPCPLDQHASSRRCGCTMACMRSSRPRSRRCRHARSGSTPRAFT